MATEHPRLKLGKGAAFVKSRLQRLPQEHDTWEADFFPLPYSDGKHDTVWLGMVLSHSHDYVPARRTSEESPTVNDLAWLLADAMQRPLAGNIHRPGNLYLRARQEWGELLPHLKQIGIEVRSQEALPEWDRAFGDLLAQVEQGRSAKGSEHKSGRRTPMARSRKQAASVPPADQGKPHLYTLDVFLLGGPVSEKFTRKNPVVSRTIQIRGDQTLEDLHHAIFDAFGRWEEHMYEFQFGKGPMDPEARRYVLPNALEIESGEKNPPVASVDQTTIESLGLKVGDRYGYWFDFGDDWWHQINVEAVEDKVSRGKFPKVTKREGKSPPQYADEDE
jgi:hypothetical protein